MNDDASAGDSRPRSGEPSAGNDRPRGGEPSDTGDRTRGSRLAGWRAATSRRTKALGRAVFGDRVGLLVWLGLVLSLAVVWRIGFFLTDSYTVANTLLNVADGHLAIRNVEYSLTLGTQPGLHQYDGVLYGRNYGQAFFALPVVWILEAGAVLAEPRFVLLGGWALGALAFSRQLGTVLDRRPTAATVGSRTIDGSVTTIAGSVVAVAALAVGVAVGTPLDEGDLVLAALQLSTVAAAAFAGVFAYRLLSTFEGRRVGLAAGLAVGLATPIGFWASLPKRHVLVATLVLGAVLCFARSRRTGSLRLRAGAYVFAGLVAWVHAFEGFFLVVALGGVDLATARSNGWRDLAVVALALSLALAPTLATNMAISDNPLKSPRLLPSVGVGGVELAPGGDLRAVDGSGGVRTSGGGGDLLDGGSGSGSEAGGGDGSGGDAGGGDGTSGESGGTGPVGWFVGVLAGFGAALIGLLPRPPDTVLVISGFVITTVTDGLAVLTAPERLFQIFVRGGNLSGVNYAVNQFEVIDLTVLESMPLLGALTVLPVLAVRSVRTHGRSLLQWPRSLSPARQTDLLVATVATVLTVIYLSRLPLQSMLTVRYVLPVYLLGLYGVARLGPVSASVRASPRSLAGAYATTLVVGGVAVVGAFTFLEPALGEAIQFHALLHVAVGTALAVVVLGRVILLGRVATRWVAVALGVAAAATTIYLTLAGLAYFPYGPFAFDAAGELAESLATLV